ncbi:MAG: hypothetical protein ACKVT0_04825 [Planctomycetaceae bacterium]
MDSKQESCYRKSVLPFGIFMVVASIVFVISAFIFPDDKIHVPVIATPFLKRLVFSIVGIIIGVIGIGLICLKKWAWYGLVLFLILGLLLWLISFSVQIKNGQMTIAEASLIGGFNILLYWGILHITAPAFRK